MNRTVLIVGGGIAGFALARALGQRGIGYTVVDRLDGPPDAGLGLNLPANAVLALRHLGLGDDVVSRGTPVRRREYRNAKGRLLFEVDEARFWGAGVTSVCVRRGDLLDLLRAGVPEESVRWNAAVTELTEAGDRVEVRFADGGTGDYDLVVGADGVYSTVRRVMLGTAQSRPSLLTAASWRFVIPGSPVDCWTVWFGTGTTFLLIPVGDGHVYGYASATGGGSVDADPQWLATTFTGYPGPVPGIVAEALANPSSLYHSAMEEVRVERWSQGRLVLIGDAAHATAPVWAQGGALAVEDALVLADELARRDDWTGAGAAFEGRRRPRVQHVQAMTDRAARTAGLPGWLRDLVAPRVGPRTFRATYGPLREPVLPSR